MTRKDINQTGTATAEELEVRRDTWLSFFDDFSLKHEDHPADLEVVQPGGNRQTVFRRSPLKSVSVNLAGSEGGSLSVSVASGPKQLNTHQVGRVSAVSLWRNEDGQDEGLDIKSEDGSRAILTLRTQQPATEANR